MPTQTTTSTNHHSQNKVPAQALALMLTFVFLSLFNAGFDHVILYWVLVPLNLTLLFLIYQWQLRIPLGLKQPALYYFFFLLFALLSIFWSINPHRTLVEFLQLSLYAIVFCFAFNLDDDQAFRVGRIALITACGVAIFGISQYLFLSSSRIESTMANANSLGIYLVMFFLAGWGYYLRKPGRLLFAAAVLLLTALLLTISRGSMICLVFAFPLLLVGLDKKALKNTLFKSALCLATSLALVQLIIFTAPYLQQLVQDGTMLHTLLTRRSSFIAWSGVSRFAFWEAGVRVALSNPVTGTGLGTFFLAYFTEFIDGIWYSRFVHNHYIQTLAELGLVGFSLLVTFFGLAINKTVKLLKSGFYPPFIPGAVAAALAFLIHIGADFSWNFPAVPALFFFSSGLILGRVEDESQKFFDRRSLLILFTIIFILAVWQSYANVYYRIGVNSELDRDMKAAAIAYDRANSVYPINSSAYSFASNAYYSLYIDTGDPVYFEQSLSRAKLAVLYSPVEGRMHNQLGRLYWEAGLLEEAELHLATAVNYSAYRLGELIDLAWFYLQAERYEEAKQVIDRGLALKEYARGMHPRKEDVERIEQQIDIMLQLESLVAD